MHQQSPSPRRVLARHVRALLPVAAGILLLGCQTHIASNSTGSTTMNNKPYYDGDTFNAEEARQAYFDMMKRFNYPISEKVRQEMWATDFALGDFPKVGMGGIFWVNKQDKGYFAHEIYLLPGQMIVEHGHEQSDSSEAKHESWHVRHGAIFTFGEGAPTEDLPVDLPESQAGHITARHCQEVKEGEIAELNRLTAKHFMIAGPEGAIVTEYGTYHDNEGLRFTNPDVSF